MSYTISGDRKAGNRISLTFTAMLTIYTYANCDTCRRAVKWLRRRDLPFAEKPIRETPPSPAELRLMLAAYPGELRRLFNVSGRDYRELGIGARMPRLSEAEAIALLAGNGNLIKRPFLIGSGVLMVGFDEAAWSRGLLQA